MCIAPVHTHAMKRPVGMCVVGRSGRCGSVDEGGSDGVSVAVQGPEHDTACRSGAVRCGARVDRVGDRSRRISVTAGCGWTSPLRRRLCLLQPARVARRSVRFLGSSATEDGAQARIAIELSSIPEDVHTIALAGSVGAGSFGDLGKLALRVVDGSGHTMAEYVTADATTESAFVFGELYRRSDQWKVRAIGQGWDSGLSGLAADFGVDIDDEPASMVQNRPTPQSSVPLRSKYLPPHRLSRAQRRRRQGLGVFALPSVRSRSRNRSSSLSPRMKCGSPRGCSR